jgi:hypothetical protein
MEEVGAPSGGCFDQTDRRGEEGTDHRLGHGWRMITVAGVTRTVGNEKKGIKKMRKEIINNNNDVRNSIIIIRIIIIIIIPCSPS